MSAQPSRVFISYAWEDDAYRRWVWEFTARLRADGVDVRLDVWHFKGDVRIPLFLDHEIRHAEWILVLCSPAYRDKVHAIEDRVHSAGVAWEESLLNQQLLASNREKIVPVLVLGSWPEAAPDFLADRVYQDLSDSRTFETNYRALLQQLTGAGEQLPSLGLLPQEDDAAAPRPNRDTPIEGASTVDAQIDPPPRPPPDLTWKEPALRQGPSFNEVWLGTAVPRSVARNSSFVARFSAYTSEYRDQVDKAIEAEVPGARKLFDLHVCQWEPGAKVSVSLSADHFHVEASPQSFVWNGKWIVLRFDVSVPASVEVTSTILRFDVSIAGLIVARLRPEIQIAETAAGAGAAATLSEVKAPDKAFASYASKDRREVLGRVRSLQIYAKIDVFLDCLSLHPGELWKERLENELKTRDLFWLFWSRNAQKSQWVEWEWRTVLNLKTLAAIQPHPLEGSDLAPPPPELSALQFGTLYESFLAQLGVPGESAV
jgi:TIR domain